MDTLEKVQGAHSDWPISMDSVGIVHHLPGECPWTLGHYPWTLSQWKVWTLSTDTLDNVQADYTMSTESMGSLDMAIDKTHSLY